MDDRAPEERLALYEALCDSLGDLVVLLDADARVMHANRRLTEATGIPVEDVVGEHYADPLAGAMSDDAITELGEHIDAVRSGVSPERRVELAVTTSPLGDVVADARLTRLETADVTGVVVVFREFTDRVEEARALETRSEQLAVVNRVLRHDVRNDMNVMLGWGEQLGDHVTTDEGQGILDRVLQHGSHVVELTHAARRLEEAIEADWEMTVEPVGLAETLTREVEFVREQFPAATVVLSPPPSDVRVRANELLGSVVENLLSNAIRHSDRDTPEVTVTVDVGPETVSVAVADDGPGIPDPQKDAVYEMGTKGPESPGTGLGLYLVKSLVDAYGGTVSIADTEPRGTVVTVELERVDS
jgi:PAS domain S-box-containing protein